MRKKTQYIVVNEIYKTIYCGYPQKRAWNVFEMEMRESGELSFFEATHDVSFEFKRMYYISKVPEGTRRGFHAHKKLKQLLFCPYGRIQLILENKYGREEIELSDPSIGVVIEEPTWREMLWLQKRYLWQMKGI